MRNHARCVGACLLVAFALAGLMGCGKQPVAIVGSTKITKDEFLARLQKDQGRSTLVGMINRKLLEDAFTASGLTVTDQELQDGLKEMKTSVGSPEAFAQALAARGMTEKDALESVALELKVRKLCAKDVKVTEQGLKAFFDQYKSQYPFTTPELVSYSELVVATQADAQRIADQLKKPAASFDALAKQNSISPQSRERGGKLPPAPASQIMPEAVRAAVLALKPGQVSAPLQVEERWYLLRLDGVQPAQTKDFVKDRKSIEELYRQANAKQPADLLSELLQKTTINVVDPKYADLNEHFRPQAKLPEFGAKGATTGKGKLPPAGVRTPTPIRPGK